MSQAWDSATRRLDCSDRFDDGLSARRFHPRDKKAAKPSAVASTLALGCNSSKKHHGCEHARGSPPNVREPVLQPPRDRSGRQSAEGAHPRRNQSGRKRSQLRRDDLEAVERVQTGTRALDLFFDRALGLTREGNKTDLLLLSGNLHNLRLMSLCPEFAALLAKAGVLTKLRPLLLHTVEWLKTDSILDPRKEAERMVAGEALRVAATAVNDDDEDALAVQVRLKPEAANDLSVILLAAADFACISFAAERKEKVTAIGWCFDNDVFGWIQGMVRWAATAADGNAKARAPLDAFVGHEFSLLGSFLGTASLANRLLDKLAPARALAERLVADVSRDVSEAGAFLTCVAQAEALRRAAAVPRWPVNARLRIHSLGGGEASEAEEGANGRMPAQQLVDTRDPSGIIGVNGDIMGIGQKDKQSAAELDWSRIVRELESGDEDVMRELLPRLTGFFVALPSRGAHLTSSEVTPRAWAESLLALLEGGKCSGLWQEPGALGSFLLVLHMAFRQPVTWAPRSGTAEQERWAVDMGSRLMAWVYPRVDRLSFAVTDGLYLEFGFALFRVLETLAASAPFEVNKLLWSAADEYMTAMLTSPTQEPRGPEAPRLMSSLEVAVLDRGILEWAVRERRPRWRQKRTPKHEALLARIFQVAGRHEPGRQRFGTCEDGVAILLGEAHFAATGAVTLHSAKLHRAATVSTRDPPVCNRDVASCLERLTRLLATLGDLTGYTSAERAHARWRELCAADGLVLLKKVLGQRRCSGRLGRNTWGRTEAGPWGRRWTARSACG
ncbi:hypothetical protein KFL_004360050 [Klebsormidium nitens]|uniref:Uncharacterized protein n=1 Tax=Klebsormidium nitens TaxID=105231 RepID=A0A1Y1ID52_KLENI|nr:hypothetical protein KFL_004360050 [Klebsormidium nitens]|eukprot:GAQ88523.1 hypothetical protein KFL_004360050 [Klebsormidium nitens]